MAFRLALAMTTKENISKTGKNEGQFRSRAKLLTDSGNFHKNDSKLLWRNQPTTVGLLLNNCWISLPAYDYTLARNICDDLSRIISLLVPV